MNPLLADIPPAMVEELAPLLPLAWLVAGMLVRARERLRKARISAQVTAAVTPVVAAPPSKARRVDKGKVAVSASSFSSPAGSPPLPPSSPGPQLAPLPEEGKCVEDALAGDGLRSECEPEGEAETAAALASALRLQIRVPLAPDGEDLDVLCERLAMQDESWDYVGAWTQVTSYEYANPLGNQSKVRTTAIPTPKGMLITHEEPVDALDLPMCAVVVGEDGSRSPLAFRRVQRRPWSRVEDAANVLSDLWVRERNGEAGVGDEDVLAGAEMAGEALAAVGCRSSELWQNHTRLLQELTSESNGGGPPRARLLSWRARRMARDTLPGIVSMTRVNHRMEKVMRNELLSLTISCESEAGGYQAAERGLWRHANLESALQEPGRTAARVTRWATIEPVGIEAWLRVEPPGETSSGSPVPAAVAGPRASPLLQALLLLRPLISLRLCPLGEFEVLAPLAGDPAVTQLWHAAFLARACSPVATLRSQLPQACAAAEHLRHGRLCEDLVDLLAEWGVFYGVAPCKPAEQQKGSASSAQHGFSLTAKPTQPSSTPTQPSPPDSTNARPTAKLYSTSGSMPRLYRPDPQQSSRFVARPKLFLAEDDEACWSWDRERRRPAGLQESVGGGIAGVSGAEVVASGTGVVASGASGASGASVGMRAGLASSVPRR